MDQTQNRISDERLAELACRTHKLTHPSNGGFCSFCEVEEMANETAAMRASHKRLVDLCREHIDALDSGYDVLASTAMDYIRAALAEARKLEGK